MGTFTGTGRTYAVGDPIKAADLNADAEALITALGAWTAYTPTWTSSGTAPVLGNGTLTGAYTQLGKNILFRFKLVCGSTTTYGTGQYFFGLPVTATSYAQYDAILGAAHVLPAAHALCTPIVMTNTTLSLLTTAGAWVAQGTPGTFANTSTVSISGLYEAA